MSLAPSEQNILAGIESRLRRSDPALAARLALFGRHAPHGAGPARELLSPWRARRGRAIRLLAVIAITIILAIVITVLVARTSPPHSAAAAICGIHAVSRRAQPAAT